MRAVVISVGDELVLGQTVDTNSAWLSERLGELGIAVCEHVTVADDVESIKSHLERSAGLADVVIVSGGLGPTDDDLTRHALAEVLGVDLVLNQDWLRRIEGLFGRMGRQMADRNRVQAMIPVSCDVLDNQIGTACGMAARIGGASVFLVPGVPREMREMFDGEIRGRLCELQCRLAKNSDSPDIGTGVILTRALRCFGTGESRVAEMLGDVMERGRNPVVNSTVADGIISIRINATAGGKVEAEQLIAPVERDVRMRLGDLVFGVDGDNLAAVVGRMLLERGSTVATAESCTGGLLGKALTDIAGSSGYYERGWVTYSNAAKTDMLGVDSQVIECYGAVSEEVAGQLAEGARRLAGSDYSLSTTGIAGPGGGSSEKPVGLVFIGLAWNGGVKTVRMLLHGDRSMVRLRAVNHALDTLRGCLAGR